MQGFTGTVLNKTDHYTQGTEKAEEDLHQVGVLIEIGGNGTGTKDRHRPHYRGTQKPRGFFHTPVKSPGAVITQDTGHFAIWPTTTMDANQDTPSWPPAPSRAPFSATGSTEGNSPQ